ncbi:DsrE family protein [Acidithiobacillus acidisediminis]|uniref:DsrE family protein n=1 Tax=Acidithiobacillus acidisediminis TaxID=2937799 RepID=UPI00200EC97C|nr:DsrE family protein [Acidithiobacillus sp. S30A2]
MSTALIVLHSGIAEANPRANTAIRLAGAMLAEDKAVRLFLVGDGVTLLAAEQEASASATQALFRELLDLGLEVQCCGNSLKRHGLSVLPSGVHGGSMKGLSAWISAADELVYF